MAKTEKKKRCLGRRLLRGCGVLAIVVVALLVAIRMVAPYAAVSVANSYLPRYLRADASVGDLDLGLLAGRVAIEDIHIDQPDGFTNAPMLEVAEISLNVRTRSLLSSPIVVEQVLLRDATVRLIKKKDGTFNVDALMPETPPEATNAVATAPAPAPEPPTEEKPPPPAVLIEKVVVQNLAFEYLDESSGSDPIHIRMYDAHLSAENILVDTARAGEKSLDGSAVLTARFNQEPQGTARLGLMAQIGVIGTNIPPMNAALRLIGFELATVGSVVPPGVAETVGGNCVDIYADAAVAPDVLDVKAKIEAAGGEFTTRIGGTPTNPEIGALGPLGTVFAGLGGRVGSLVLNVGEAGVETVEAVGESALAVAEGAGKVVSSIGGGLFKSVKGVVTGDLKGAADGVVGIATDTVNDLGDTAGNVAGSVTEGVSDTANTAVGTSDARRWREKVGERWETLWTKVCEELPQRPFPAPKGEPTEEPEEADPEADPAPSTSPASPAGPS